MTIISILDLKIQADSLADADAVLTSTLSGTRTRPGFEGAEITIDIDDPTHYIVIEKWASLADDDAYRAWRNTPEGASTLGAILAAPPTLTRTELREL